MSFRWYPIYQKGNPQLRIFLPNFWLKLVKPQFEQPKNMVQFIAPTEMTDHDIREYLEKIYQVKVADVRSKIEEGELKQQRTKGYVIKGPDFRRAFITLQHGETFEFPEMFEEKVKEEETDVKKVKAEIKKNYESYQERNKSRPGVPGWFSF